MVHSAVAIANEFLKLSGKLLDQMKLQKLVYIAHGWKLALTGDPLVSDKVEAWDGGPVFREIWDHIKYYGYDSQELQLLEPKSKTPVLSLNLSNDDREIIEHVWKKYGHYSGNDLSEMTHQIGTPWYGAYRKGRNTIIQNDEIRDHYIELAMAGRQGETQS